MIAEKITYEAGRENECSATDMLREALRNAEKTRAAAVSAARGTSDFLADVSHDIRVPLSSILGLAVLIRRDMERPEQLKAHLNRLNRAAMYLMYLINSVLDLKQLDDDTYSLNISDVRLTDIIEEVDTIISQQALAKNQIFRITINGALSEVVKTDRTCLSRVLINLLANAVKYTPVGGKIKLDITELPCPGVPAARIRFVVADNGTGMSPEFQRIVFEPYAREKRCGNETVKGTGLGMAITRKLVDRMGGRISVRSTPGVGTAFEVLLDMERSEYRRNVFKDGDAECACGSLYQGMHIMIVDDNSMNLEILADIMTSEGAVCDCAGDGRQAVSMFVHSAENTYDAILMDVRMPGMDGYEATKAIRSSGRSDGRTVAVIALTGNAFADDIKKTAAAGMNAHLSKPVDMEQMRRTLRKFCR